MSRRIKRTQSSPRARDERKGPRPFREREHGAPKAGFRASAKSVSNKSVSNKSPRFAAERSEQRRSVEQPAKPAKPAAEPAALPTKVQTVLVTADENNMRVDRFLEARFPGLSFSHIQRIVRKGELRVNGKRADSKDRLEEGQSVRIPPLRLDAPKLAASLSETERKALEALKAMTLFEDDDVLVLNKPAGLAVQGGSVVGRES